MPISLTNDLIFQARTIMQEVWRYPADDIPEEYFADYYDGYFYHELFPNHRLLSGYATGARGFWLITRAKYVCLTYLIFEKNGIRHGVHKESEIYMPKAYHDYIKQLKSKQAAISADCRRTP